jgi:tRNA (adenine58-N1)-methyltransferase non-catalytic subunit
MLIHVVRNYGQEIIQKQIEQHANYQLKTEYSKDKYKKRKEAKYSALLEICPGYPSSHASLSRFSRTFSTLEPTIFNSCEYWFNKDPAKIRHIRIDTLGQMMSLANVHPGGRYLVVDDAAGMVIATMLERLGGMSLASGLNDP